MSRLLPPRALRPVRSPPPEDGAAGAVVPEFCRVVAVATPTPTRRSPSKSGFRRRPRGTASCSARPTADSPERFGTRRWRRASREATRPSAPTPATPAIRWSSGSAIPEKIVDWAYRSIHVMTEVAKLVVRSAQRTFSGSRVLRRLLDRRTAGAQRSAALSARLRRHRRRRSRSQPRPADSRLPVVLDGAARRRRPAAPAGGEAAAASPRPPSRACDASDGLKDGLIADPPTCTFDPATLACHGADDDTCLTPPQVARCRRSTTARATRAPASRSFRDGRAAASRAGAPTRQPGRAGPRRVLPVLRVPRSDVGLAHVRLGSRRRLRRRAGAGSQRHLARSIAPSRRAAASWSCTPAWPIRSCRRRTPSTTTRTSRRRWAGWRRRRSSSGSSRCPAWATAAAAGPEHVRCAWRARAVGGERRGARSSILRRTRPAARSIARGRCARFRRWRATRERAASTTRRASAAPCRLTPVAWTPASAGARDARAARPRHGRRCCSR